MLLLQDPGNVAHSPFPPKHAPNDLYPDLEGAIRRTTARED